MSKNAIYSGADALDWNEAMALIEHLCEDRRWREAMLIGTGCYLGLRISDLLKLSWNDLLEDRPLTITEQKTSKQRSMRINHSLQQLALRCHDKLRVTDDSEPVFSTQMYGGRRSMSRQRASQLLKQIATRYGISSADQFSTHSLRKTFGRRVWTQECQHGRGEQALLLLCEVFGHSSVNITKRYLGIRRDEILSVYDSL